MDHSSDDDECFSVQLGGSDMSPTAYKTILRRRFPMRKYNLEQDGRLTNLARVLEQPTDNLAPYSTSSPHTGDTITESIAAILQPHTSSPSMHITARAMTSLIAGNFGDNDLCQLLNAQLNTLAISPQTKQAIIPTLLGIAKLTEVHSRAYHSYTSAPLSQAPTQPVLESSSISMDTQPTGSLVPYQMYQRSFTSSSGSGQTIWYFAKSNASIAFPPAVPQAKTGHLYVHFDQSTNSFQYWMLGTSNQWDSVSKGAEYPLNHDRVLSIRSNGEPSWVTRASTVTTQTRKVRAMQERSMHT
ncbi:hypothetical protein BC826DRAFT_1110482 [Russula brevipes]|nr:hypothetical protein BC826DRAFT_1110482 [Russula brevipes]